MTRCIVLIAGMAFGWALSANEATAQTAAPRGSTKVRPTLFNPFASFSLSRFTLSPFGFVDIGAANTSGATSSASGGDVEGDVVVAAAAVRPPYRPPVRSPYRPPPRPPF